MTRTITRSYTFTERDVREALCAWLRSKDVPSSKYLATADTTQWTPTTDGVQHVEWVETDEID